MKNAEAEALKLKIVRDRPTLGELTNSKRHAPRKLDVGCGQNKLKGFKGIDLSGDADITHDLFTYPWPIKSGSVKEIHCSHFIEHIPHYRPDYQGTDGWWMFFDELYRIMGKDATARFIHPYVWNSRAFWDPTHVRFIHEQTWWYLSRDWRTANGLDHYGADVDFEIITINASGITDEMMARPDEYQAIARNSQINVIADLEVIIRKR